jgi:carbamoyl-phosphate synthase/aspartate carbamoyltransferase/dihydroorotase
MGEIITLPGLIDPHVHLRDPGQTHKEDFFTGTSAALAGGFVAVIDQPNNLVPMTTKALLEEKKRSAQKKIVCDIGFNFGTLADNFDAFDKIADEVVALKVYLNQSTGKVVVDRRKLLDIYKAWPSDKPIMLHAMLEHPEDDVLDYMLDAVRKTKKKTHLGHVSSRRELEYIIKAKNEGLPVTCGVCAHYFFLTSDDVKRLGSKGIMVPSLKSQADQDFLWANLDAIDCFESDHAPHTLEEKRGNPPPFGVPGLETTLPLMLTAEQQGKLKREQLLEKSYHNPAKIFNIPRDETTKIEVSMEEYEIKNEDLKTKCGWSPFAGRKVVGKVKKVHIRGSLVYEDGKILAEPGSGRIIS